MPSQPRASVLLALAYSSFLCAAPPPFHANKTDLLHYRDVAGLDHRIKTPGDWAKRRADILANMQLVMGPLPDASKKVPLDVQITEEVMEEKYVRKKLTFVAEPGDRVPAYLLIPRERKGKLPAMLCLHQTIALGKAEPAGLGKDENKQYAKQLAERGYVTLAPDYPNFGDYKCDPYKLGYASATMKGIWNHQRAVDLLMAWPEVDGERIGVIGHSLGGHNSLFVAAFDERIKCVVSSCGFCSFPTYYGGDLKGWSHNGYMPRIKTEYDLKPERMPFDFTEIIAALAPRPFMACAPVRDNNFDVQGVKDCMAAARPVYGLFGATDRLAAQYPDCAHDFPPEVRQIAYAWLDRWLKPQ